MFGIVMAKKKVTELIAEWMQPFGTENGYELSRSEFVKEAGSWYLRVYIDRIEESGEYGWMTSDDCEKVSRYLSDKLDEEDPIKQNYVLEVSSPGLDRPLISEKDFKRFMGSLIDIKLYEPFEGKKELTGELSGYDGKTVSIKADGKEITLPVDKTAKINLAVVF